MGGYGGGTWAKLWDLRNPSLTELWADYTSSVEGDDHRQKGGKDDAFSPREDAGEQHSKGRRERSG